jgi:cyclophilin family peptidyl-prolyl cis-trans isomerase
MVHRSTWLAAIALLAALGCRRSGPPPAVTEAPRGQTSGAQRAAAAVDLFAAATVTGEPPAGAPPLQAVLQQLRRELELPQLGRVAQWATPESLDILQERAGNGAFRLPLTANTLRARFAAEVEAVEYQGGRAAVRVRPLRGGGPRGAAAGGGGVALTSWFYLQQGQWRVDLADTRPLAPHWPGPADPDNHGISLAEAVTGLTANGPLVAQFQTSGGEFSCLLHEDRVPEPVAHFIGLARGLRASRRTQGRELTTQWQRRPLYDGTVIHRGLPGQRIEGGDPFGQGTGHAGFRIADRFDVQLRHDKPGVLGLWTLGPHSASSMFYVTLAAAPTLDDRAVIIGLCRELEVIDRISRQPRGAVTVHRVTIRRGWPP